MPRFKYSVLGLDPDPRAVLGLDPGPVPGLSLALEAHPSLVNQR